MCRLYLLLHMRDVLDLKVNQDESDTSRWGKVWASNHSALLSSDSSVEPREREISALYKPFHMLFLGSATPDIICNCQKCKTLRNMHRCTCFWLWIWKWCISIKQQRGKLNFTNVKFSCAEAGESACCTGVRAWVRIPSSMEKPGGVCVSLTPVEEGQKSKLQASLAQPHLIGMTKQL